DPEDGVGRGRRRSVGGVDGLGAEAQDVGARREHLPIGATPGQAERVAAGKQVAETGDDAEALPLRRPELDVEEADRLDLLAGRAYGHAPGAEREHDRSALRRLELPVRETDGIDERAPRPWRDRPRDSCRARATGRDDDHAARAVAELRRRRDTQLHGGRGAGTEAEVSGLRGERRTRGPGLVRD